MEREDVLYRGLIHGIFDILCPGILTEFLQSHAVEAYSGCDTALAAGHLYRVAHLNLGHATAELGASIEEQLVGCAPAVPVLLCIENREGRWFLAEIAKTQTYAPAQEAKYRKDQTERAQNKGNTIAEIAKHRGYTRAQEAVFRREQTERAQNGGNTIAETMKHRGYTPAQEAVFMREQVERAAHALGLSRLLWILCLCVAL